MRILNVLTLAIFTVFLSLSSAQADIFLKKDNSSNKNTNKKSIFLNQNDSSSRSIPQYPVISNGGSRTNGSQPLSLGNEAQRLQAQKLRETRAREYRRSRADSINMLTLVEDYSKRTGKTTLDQLVDRSAYNAANQLASQATTQSMVQQGQAQQGQGSISDQYTQNIQNIQQQAEAEANAQGQDILNSLESQNPNNMNQYSTPERRSRGNSGIILTP